MTYFSRLHSGEIKFIEILKEKDTIWNKIKEDYREIDHVVNRVLFETNTLFGTTYSVWATNTTEETKIKAIKSAFSIMYQVLENEFFYELLDNEMLYVIIVSVINQEDVLLKQKMFNTDSSIFIETIVFTLAANNYPTAVYDNIGHYAESLGLPDEFIDQLLSNSSVEIYAPTIH